jgi:hypothetical protein
MKKSTKKKSISNRSKSLRVASFNHHNRLCHLLPSYWILDESFRSQVDNDRLGGSIPAWLVTRDMGTQLCDADARSVNDWSRW